MHSFRKSITSHTVYLLLVLMPATSYALDEYDPNPGGLCFAHTDIESTATNHTAASAGYTSPETNLAMMQTPLPPSVSGNYPELHQYYPGNSFTTTRHDLISKRWNPSAPTQASKKQYYTLWANRCADVDNSGSCPNSTRFKGNYYYIDRSHKSHIGYEDVIGGILKPELPGPEGLMKRYELRPQFTSVEKADGCTRLNLARSLGFPESYLRTLSQVHGLVDESPDGEITYRYHEMSDVLQNWRSLISAPTDKKNTRYYYFKDRCIVVPHIEADKIDGVLLDWEVHDYRTIAQTKRQIDRISQSLDQKDKQFVFFTNSLSNPNAVKANGLISGESADVDFSTLNHIYESVDYFSPIVWSGATAGNSSRQLPARDRQILLNGTTTDWNPVVDLQHTLSLIDKAMSWGPEATKDYSKILPFVSLFDTRLSEAMELDTIRKTQGISGYGLWRNYVKQNGSCQKTVQASPTVGMTMPNQVIACLTMSRCDGQFREIQPTQPAH